MVNWLYFYATEVHEVPFLERETSYPEDSAFSIDNISQTTLKSLKCKKNVSINF